MLGGVGQRAGRAYRRRGEAMSLLRNVARPVMRMTRNRTATLLTASGVAGAILLAAVAAWAVARADRRGGDDPAAPAGAASVAWSPGVATAAASGAGEQRGMALAIDNTYADTPRQPTAAECADARPRMEALAAMAKARVDQIGNAEMAALLQTRLAQSRAWFDAGCPSDPVLGIYPAKDGTGSKNVFLDFPGR